MPPPPTRYDRESQGQRFRPLFDRLREALDNDVDPMVLRRDPTALVPESLLVFEVSDSIKDFSSAVSKIPGLSLVGEDVVEDEEDGESGGFYYLMVPNQSALERIERLWRRWQAGDNLANMAPIRELFACLRRIRRWSAQDRVTETDAELLRALAYSSPHQKIGVEIELVFKVSERVAAASEEEVRNAVAGLNGDLLDRARHPSFASHVLLVALPAIHVLRIAERDEASIAGLNPVLSICPQSFIEAGFQPEVGRPLTVDSPLPARAPIVGILDAVPVGEHPFLAGRLRIDDPDRLEERSVGQRFHGTAMASIILHGDLNAPGDALARPLYFRPLMYAPNVGDPREVFPNNRLVVDRFYDAIVRMKEGEGGEGAVSPDVIVVNVSLGDSRRRFSGRLSRWARAIDHLAWRFGILFVVSAGNLDIDFVDDVPVPGVADTDDLAAMSATDRSLAILAGLRDVMRDRAILAPADSVNALTVGASHDDAITPRPSPNGPTLDPFPDTHLPNITSAPGPGFGRAVKPEILMPGGRERVLPVAAPDGLRLRGRPASGAAGLKVASPPLEGAGLPNSTTYIGQTSAAAAVATRTAHRIHDALEAAYGPLFANLGGAHRALVLKALLVHRARWTSAAEDIMNVFGPQEARRWQKRRANVARLLGFGVVDPDEAVFCAANRATAWNVGSLRANRGAVFRVPLPPALSGQVVPHSVTVTLAWFTPVAPGRQSYRQVRLTIAEPDQQTLGRVGLEKAADQPDQMAARRGTVTHRRFEGEAAAALVENDALSIKIQREPDLGSIIEDDVPFAIAVSVEASGNLPIYEQVAVRLAVRPAVEVPVAARVLSI